jgi:hypothetical protein
MKKLLILLCISSWFACNNAAKNREESVQTTEDAHPHGKASKQPLNNGAKWKSDENTNRNVAELEVIVNKFNTTQPKLTADFINVANELQSGLDKMIKECRMEGPDHEALHQWLEPLLENVAVLKKATTEKEALKSFDAIREQLETYHQYFE